MSVKGCYTDFHVDFGGTSVWYHIHRGGKVQTSSVCSVCSVMGDFQLELCRNFSAWVFLTQLCVVLVSDLEKVPQEGELGRCQSSHLP